MLEDRQPGETKEKSFKGFAEGRSKIMYEQSLVKNS